MIIYLYVKTHNVTGLKYLGKTSASNPHTYRGSGTYWNAHLRIHGYNYSTEILRECSSKLEVQRFGIYYSELWNIVAATDANGKKIWANLKPESGDGGCQPLESIEKMKNTKKLNGTENRNPMISSKMVASKKKNGTLNGNTLQSIAKGIATKKANGTDKMSSKTKLKLSSVKTGCIGRKFSAEDKAAHSIRLTGHKKHNVLVSRLEDRKVMTLCSFTRWCNQSYTRPTHIGPYKKVVSRLVDRRAMTLGKFSQWSSAFPSD
jgi:hypothetical protein